MLAYNQQQSLQTPRVQIQDEHWNLSVVTLLKKNHRIFSAPFADSHTRVGVSASLTEIQAKSSFPCYNSVVIAFKYRAYSS